MNEPPPTGVPPVPSSPRKTSPWLIAGLGCLAVLLVGFVGATVAVNWGAKKVAQYTKNVIANPEKFAAEMIMKNNPKLEIVTSDPSLGRMTIREKATGNETTFSYKDIAQGRLSIQAEAKEISIDASDAANASDASVHANTSSVPTK